MELSKRLQAVADLVTEALLLQISVQIMVIFLFIL